MIQEKSTCKAKLAQPVKGYYNDDEIEILREALIQEAIEKGEIEKISELRDKLDNSFIADIFSNGKKKSVILPPIVAQDKDKTARLTQLKKDLIAAHHEKINQILVPINIRDFHWYNLKIAILYTNNIVNNIYITAHDSLYERYKKDLDDISKDLTEIILSSFKTDNSKIKIIDSLLPLIQKGKGNNYCGGYTTRLAINLIKNPNIDSSENLGAWGCDNNKKDDSLRREDAKKVTKYNNERAYNFGKSSISQAQLLQRSESASATRETIANDKLNIILQGIEDSYNEIPQEIKQDIKNLIIPNDVEEISSCIKDLYFKLPKLLACLFQNKAARKENLIITTDIEIEHIFQIIQEIKEKFLEFDDSVSPKKDKPSFLANENDNNHEDEKKEDNSFLEFKKTDSQIKQDLAVTIDDLLLEWEKILNIYDKDSQQNNQILDDHTDILLDPLPLDDSEACVFKKPNHYPNDLTHGLLAGNCYIENLNAQDKVSFDSDNELYLKFKKQNIDLNQYLSN